MIIAKQMQIRSNIKKYFDMAFSGETIIFPRKDNMNVVILSEAEYNSLKSLQRLEAYSQKYRSISQKRNKKQSSQESILKDSNLKKLKYIKNSRMIGTVTEFRLSLLK